MITKNMAEALNRHTTREYYSYWLYRQMAYRLDSMGLKIFAQWFSQQASEEVMHAEKFASYILDQGGEVHLEKLDKPEGDFSTVEKVCNAALEHEKKITAWINELVGVARSANDYATEQFLSWFVSEQVEEEATVTQLRDMVKMAESPGQLLMLEDRIMALRSPSGAGE
jgi:ferritin